MFWCIVDRLRWLFSCGGSGADNFEVDGRKFRKIRKLGEGLVRVYKKDETLLFCNGFSYVYLVQEVGGERRKYALKRMMAHSKRELQRCKQEIEIHRLCDGHPNIIALLASRTSSSSDNDTTMVYTKDKGLQQATEVLMVMPYYKRGTIQDELDRRRTCDEPRIDEHRVLQLFAGVCAAVAQLHALDPPLAHRDLKPHNVLLADDDTPVLMDFGSVTQARVDISNKSFAQRVQDDAAEFCSMAYRPPELFEVDGSSAIDERTDIWSLGCLLYALCFFQSPFDLVYQRGDSVALAVQSATSVKIPDDSSYSESLHQLIRRLINIDLYMRPNIQSVIEAVQFMISDLRPKSKSKQRKSSKQSETNMEVV